MLLMAKARGGKPEGVVVRHRKGCACCKGGRCNCEPGYQAQVFSARERRTIRKTFKTLAEARAWRAESQVALSRGLFRGSSRQTLEEVSAAWFEAARSGVIRTRSGDIYKNSALRSYEQSLTARILPRFGHLKTTALTRNDVQDMVDEILAEGLGPSSARNALMPLRAIYRRLISRGEVSINPTVGLLLPAERARRERVARPEEAQTLLAALTPKDQVVWATALYAGLRRGELRALRWSDIDLENGLIRVERGWDPEIGPILPKSRAGKRRVPLAAPLRVYLLEHRLRSEGAGEALVFTGRGGKSLAPDALIERARRAWQKRGLQPIVLHECRHTYAAFMIAAGVNAKALSTYMGHSTITMTLDRYGHLMPGNEEEAATMLTHYLAKEVGESR
jgi:integrase